MTSVSSWPAGHIHLSCVQTSCPLLCPAAAKGNSVHLTKEGKGSGGLRLGLSGRECDVCWDGKPHICSLTTGLFFWMGRQTEWSTVPLWWVWLWPTEKRSIWAVLEAIAALLHPAKQTHTYTGFFIGPPSLLTRPAKSLRQYKHTHSVHSA